MADNKGYTFSGKTGNAEPTPKDTDLSHDSPHHTLGKGPLNAASGNHTHTADQVGLPVHTHPASDVDSEILATARLGTGTANADKFLRGDQSWQTPATLAHSHIEGDLPGTLATDTEVATAVSNHASGVPHVIPGLIMIWPVATAPTGWHLCDGTAHGSSDLTTLLGSSNAPTLTDYATGYPLIIKK